jgi:hypothetical protein
VYQNLFIMAIKFALNLVDADKVIVVNTPLATDAVLALGKLTLLDESGAQGVAPLIRDVVGSRKTAYTTGTAEVNTIDLTSVPAFGGGFGNDSTFKLTIALSNVIEPTGALRAARTYIVSTDATATTDELGALFAARINNDLDAGVTAAYNTGSNVLTITAGSANYGNMIVKTSFAATVVVSVPFVAPSGVTADAAQYFPANGSIVSGTAQYVKYLLKARKLIRHNAVTGLSVFKNVNYLVFVDGAAGAGFTAYAAALDAALAGTTATAGAYTGTPAI